MDWTHTLSIITTVIASAYYIHREIQMDIKQQSARTDRLYEMFCKTQKQIRNDFLDIKKEHYEFLRNNLKKDF